MPGDRPVEDVFADGLARMYETDGTWRDPVGAIPFWRDILTTPYVTVDSAEYAWMRMAYHQLAAALAEGMAQGSIPAGAEYYSIGFTGLADTVLSAIAALQAHEAVHVPEAADYTRIAEAVWQAELGRSAGAIDLLDSLALAAATPEAQTQAVWWRCLVHAVAQAQSSTWDLATAETYSLACLPTLEWEEPGPTRQAAPAPTSALLQGPYATPSPGRYTLDALPEWDNAHIRVYDLTGRLLHQERPASWPHTLDLRTQPPGLYLLQIAGSRGNWPFYLRRE